MIELKAYQKEAISELRTGSILVGGVGTGKSLTSLAYFFTKVCDGVYDENYIPPKKTKDLYIITTAQKRDKHEWEADANHLLLSTDPEISVSGIKMVIDSWNNIKKYQDVEDAFFIFDEQRLVGYGAWVKAFFKIAKKNDWILLSATPGDQWTDYIPVFIANGFYKNKSEFIAKHVVYKPFTNYPIIQRYLYVGELVKLREKITVYMQGDKATVRGYTSVECFFDKELYSKTIKNMYDYVNDEMIESEPQLRIVLRKIVNTDESRIRKLDGLIRDRNKVIIFYNYNYELDLLKTHFDEIGRTYAEWNGHVHEYIPKTDSWIYLVQYAAGSEGWKCIETDTIIFYSLNYSYRMMEQAAGRIDRMNTPFKHLNYYCMVAKGSIDEAVLSCIKRKENFNEVEYYNFKDLARKY